MYLIVHIFEFSPPPAPCSSCYQLCKKNEPFQQPQPKENEAFTKIIHQIMSQSGVVRVNHRQMHHRPRNLGTSDAEDGSARRHNGNNNDLHQPNLLEAQRKINIIPSVENLRRNFSGGKAPFEMRNSSILQTHELEPRLKTSPFKAGSTAHHGSASVAVFTNS